jgi:hypothetical protein
MCAPGLRQNPPSVEADPDAADNFIRLRGNSVGGRYGKLQSAGEQVYVIAESVSTSMEAHRIINQRRWIEVRLRRAQFVLVVVRSELEMPLTGFYESVGELKRDAEMQLNISGSNYVVYIFGLDDDLRPTELKRVAYPAND